MTALTPLEKVLAALILGIIIFFSLFHLTESPPFQVDEGWAVQVATNIAERGINGLQFSPGNIEHVSVLTSVGFTLLYPLALWFKIFGSGVFEARAMMVVYMLSFAVVCFIFLRRLYGTRITLLSLAILSSFPGFYAFGKGVIGEVPLLLFLVLFLLFLNLALHQPHRKHFWLILAGVSAGLCIVTKTMALAFVPVLVIAAFISWKKDEVSVKEIGIMTLCAFVPIAVWVITNFQPGDTLTSVLDYYTNPSALTDKTATFWSNIKMFASGIGPLFMMSLLVVWVTGVVIRMKTRVKITTEELIALIFSLTLTCSLLFRYWDARYLFPIQILGILFAPYSAYYILQILPVGLSTAKRTVLFYCGGILLVLAGLYQVSFNSYVANWYSSTKTADLSSYFASLPISTSILFYNSPNAVPLFHGTDYYQRIVMFEKWVLGTPFAPIVKDAQVDMLVLEALSKDDRKIPLAAYEKTAQFGEISIFKRKSTINDTP